MKEFLELTQVQGIAVGHCPLEVSPDEFVGVEFGRVAGEPMSMQARVLTQELLDRWSLMLVTTIP